MKVHYEDRGTEKLCTNEREARRRRADIATKLRLRVNALEAAGDVAQLQTLDPLGYWHELTADRPGYWSGRLSKNWRLIFFPEGGGDALLATEVTVIELVDYH